ncbi:MAG: SelL-related redox protein [Verrucomicrobiota bacterium JB023]|nr:SelL-related redox protein [Verrucomicrobiota bacterium JB023]
MRLILVSAGLYNVAFAIWSLLWPQGWVVLCDLPWARYPEVWQALGLKSGLLGIGYLIAALQPYRYWPIILIGFLGKLIAPLGFLEAASAGSIPWRVGWILVFNDVLWLVPFAAILWEVLRSALIHHSGREEPYSPAEASALFHLSSGESLLEASRERDVVLVFLRHFGCTFTREILKSLRDLKAESDRRETRLVLVHMLQRGQEEGYLPAKESVSRIADPHCDLYRAFGLGKGTLLELFGPRVWLRGVAALFKGCGVGLFRGDGLQMPGAFLVRDGAIIASQPARHAAERPDLPALFDGLSSQPALPGAHQTVSAE